MRLQELKKIFNSESTYSVIENNFPIITYLFIYVFFVLSGTWFILDKNSLLAEIYYIISGVSFIELTSSKHDTFLMVLLIPPVAFVTSYVLTNSFFKKRKIPFVFEEESNFKLLVSFWAISFVMAIVALKRADAFENAATWLASYDEWIAARYKVLTTIGVYEFVNIYILLPTLTVIISLKTYAKTNKLIMSLAILIPAVVIEMLVFQKRPLMIFLLIYLASFVIYKKSFKYLFAGALSILFIFLVYLLLVLLPSLEIKKTKLVSPNKVDAGKQEKVLAKREFRKNATQLVNEMKFTERVSVSAIGSLFFRVSLPALFYVQAYPEIYPYEEFHYPFKANSPTDNVDVYKLMWPGHNWGNASAPANFIFYSQVGVWGSILCFVVLGCFTGICWNYFKQGVPSPERIVQSSLLLIFMMYITMDSFVNSISTSYGIMWGLALVQFILIITSLKKRITS